MKSVKSSEINSVFDSIITLIVGLRKYFKSLGRVAMEVTGMAETAEMAETVVIVKTDVQDPPERMAEMPEKMETIMIVRELYPLGYWLYRTTTIPQASAIKLAIKVTQ